MIYQTITPWHEQQQHQPLKLQQQPPPGALPEWHHHHSYFDHPTGDFALSTNTPPLSQTRSPSFASSSPLSPREQRLPMSSSFDGSRSPLRSSLYNVTDTRITAAVHVPADRVGLIIGKSGSTIRTLQEQSGAQVLVPPPSPNPMSTRTITITGGEQQVAYCKALIEVGITRISKNWSLRFVPFSIVESLFCLWAQRYLNPPPANNYHVLPSPAVEREQYNAAALSSFSLLGR